MSRMEVTLPGKRVYIIGYDAPTGGWFSQDERIDDEAGETQRDIDEGVQFERLEPDFQVWVKLFQLPADMASYYRRTFDKVYIRGIANGAYMAVFAGELETAPFLNGVYNFCNDFAHWTTYDRCEVILFDGELLTAFIAALSKNKVPYEIL